MKYLLLLFLIVSCAGYQVLVAKPDVSVVNTGVSKNVAYNNALTYLGFAS